MQYKVGDRVRIHLFVIDGEDFFAEGVIHSFEPIKYIKNNFYIVNLDQNHGFTGEARRRLITLGLNGWSRNEDEIQLAERFEGELEFTV